MALKDDVKISINHLDQAAIDQPSLFAEWGERWAEATMNRDRLKERLATVKAEADEAIRSNPKAYGWVADKAPTEAWVASQIVIHKQVLKVSEELLAAQYDVNMASVGKESMDHRRKALEILTTLYANSYFVAKSRTNPEYVEEMTKKGAAEQVESLDKNERMGKRRRST